MPTPRTVAARVHQCLTRPTDTELLARFVESRDDAAFTELVHRHGPVILAVCRRITGNRQDADDACQMTFLVLARKADRVRPATSLGGWLYGVALRAARKILARSCRRRDLERTVGELPDVPQYQVEQDPDTVEAVLEEVARLPDHLRAAVVLCELEGRSRSLAARELGIPEGTLSSRLAAARKCLAARLRDRSLAPAVLAAVAGTTACPVLAAEAVRLGAAPVSPGIEKLMEAIMRPEFGIRLKLAVAVVAAVAVALSVGGTESPKPTDPPVETKQRVEAPAPGGRLLLMKVGGFDVVAADGKALAAVPLAKDAPGLGWLSPDGKQVAYVVPKALEPDGEQQNQLVIRDAVGGRFTTIVDVNACQLCWSPSGKTVYASRFPDEERLKNADHCRIDLAARTVEKVDWPADVRPMEWAPDGKSVLVCYAKDRALILALMSPDGKTLTDLTGFQDDDWVMAEARLSPEGRRVLYTDIPPGKKGKDDSAMTRRLYVYDVTTKKRTEVAGVPLNATVFWCCWSPDGKKIAYVWRQRHAALAERLTKGEPLSTEELATETEMFVIVANADGSDARTVASTKGDGIMDLPFQGIDWRGASP